MAHWQSSPFRFDLRAAQNHLVMRPGTVSLTLHSLQRIDSFTPELPEGILLPGLLVTGAAVATAVSAARSV